MKRETMIKDLIDNEIHWAIEGRSYDEVPHISNFIIALFTSYNDKGIKKIWDSEIGHVSQRIFK
jgi:hypothetical protein